MARGTLAAGALACSLATVAILAASPSPGATGAAPAPPALAGRIERPAEPGDSVTTTELAGLARRALDDPTALAQLRRVRSVDGQPVDLRAALAGASGPELRSRLAALAGLSTPSPPPVARSADARDTARAVLGRRKYHPRRLPRPLAGALRWLGDRLAPVFGPIGRWLQRIADSPGGALAVALVLAALFAVAAVRLAMGRTRAAARAEHRSGRLLVDPSADPDELDRRAEAAERDGDLAAAIRLRYEAGLLRLQRAGALELRPDTTTGDASRQVDQPRFTALTLMFEEVVYGDRAVTAADVFDARAGWAELLGVGVGVGR